MVMATQTSSPGQEHSARTDADDECDVNGDSTAHENCGEDEYDYRGLHLGCCELGAYLRNFSAATRYDMVVKKFDNRPGKRAPPRHDETGVRRMGWQFPWLRHGQASEPRALRALCAIAGFDMSVHVVPGSVAGSMEGEDDREWDLPYDVIAGRPDFLMDNCVGELKAPWAAYHDCELPVELSSDWLYQVYAYLELYKKPFALVAAYTGDHLHVWRVARDDPNLHSTDASGNAKTWWRLLGEELRVFWDMRDIVANHGWDPAMVPAETRQRIIDSHNSTSSRNEDYVRRRDMRTAMAIFREKCVYKIVAPKRFNSRIIWGLASSETATNPDATTLVDRFVIPKGGQEFAAQRLVRVWWTSSGLAPAGNSFHVYDPVLDAGGAPVSGGVIRSHWHTYDPAVTTHAKVALGPRAWGTFKMVCGGNKRARSPSVDDAERETTRSDEGSGSESLVEGC